MDMIKKIHDIVLTDRRVKIREIADIVDKSTERIQNISHEKLSMRKPSARWLPRFLTVEQKRNRLTTSEHIGHVKAQSERVSTAFGGC